MKCKRVGNEEERILYLNNLMRDESVACASDVLSE